MDHSTIIKRLFSGWQGQADQLSREQVALYLETALTFTPADLAQAVQDFTRGMVPSHRKAFLPTCAELGDHTRKVRNERLDRESRAAPRRTLSAPPIRQFTDEEHASRKHFIDRYVTPVVRDMRKVDGISAAEHEAAKRRTIAEAIGVDAEKLNEMIDALPDRKPKAA